MINSVLILDYLFDSMEEKDARKSIPRNIENIIASIGQEDKNLVKEVRRAFGSQDCDNDCLERCLVLMANILDDRNTIKALSWSKPVRCSKRK